MLSANVLKKNTESVVFFSYIFVDAIEAYNGACSYFEINSGPLPLL